MALSLSFIYAAMASEATVALRISTGVLARLAVRQRAYFWQTDSCSNIQTGILQPFLVHCKFPCTHPWHELDMPVSPLGTGRALYYHGLLEATRFQIDSAAVWPTLVTIANAAFWNKTLLLTAGL